MEQEKVQVFVKLCESSKEEPVIEITDNGQTVEVDGAEYEVHKVRLLSRNFYKPR